MHVYDYHKMINEIFYKHNCINHNLKGSLSFNTLQTLHTHTLISYTMYTIEHLFLMLYYSSEIFFVIKYVYRWGLV